MNKIVNFKVLPAIAAFVFFLTACSSDQNNNIGDISSPSGQVESSSSQDKDGDGGAVSSSSSASSSASLSSSSVQNASSSSEASSASSKSSSSSAQNKSSSSSAVKSSSSFAPIDTKDYTEKVGSASFDMIYIPGGTFTLGCQTNCQPGAAKPVEDVKVSSYFIMKGEASSSLWTAVMGKSHAGGTWYEAIEFACELSKKTGKNYRMMTEAEFEYAAKNYKDKLSNIGGSGMTGEEWAYNSWDADKHWGGTDPVGPTSGQHTQKTRRDADANGADRITSRLIRSIDGIGPSTRLVVSADVAYPPGYVPNCDIHPPVAGAEPANSYRDPRWITNGDSHWKPQDSKTSIGNLDLTVWEDGTAKLGSANGQWFTSNNITFVFVPSSGSITKFAYIFLDDKQGSVIGEKSFMNGGFLGRFVKESKTTTQPSVSGLKSGEDLAKAQSKFADEYKMVDMTSLPKKASDITSAYKQDNRLLDGGDTKGWFQDNTPMQGAHHYRKDIDLDEFRFTVNQNNQRAAVLAVGKWFTINNTFLRVIHSNGYIADYLYTIADDGTFYHNSFMGYEKADFRMFKKETNGSSWPKTTCGDICSQEIPKGLSPAAMYVNDKEKGQSTFTPAPCPSGGCK